VRVGDLLAGDLLAATNREHASAHMAEDGTLIRRPSHEPRLAAVELIGRVSPLSSSPTVPEDARTPG
jgi:hypothetical protein